MVNAARLFAAYKKDLADAWALYRRKHPDHVPYAFVLWGIESPVQFSAHVLTEQGLARVVERYVREGYYETVEEAREALRFSVADSPFFNELMKELPTVGALLKPHLRKFDDKGGYRLQAKAAIRALKALDKQKLFGLGADRQQLLLCIITEDTGEEWFEPSLRQLNGKSALKWLPPKVEGRFCSIDKIAIAPDGKSLYAIGSDSDDDESISIIVAYDLRGSAIKKRWSFTFPSFGDSARDIACAPDSKSIVGLRAQYEDRECTTILMRFRSNRNTPIAEQQIPGEPDSLAISQDGSRIAVSMHETRLVIFDEKLQPILTRQIRNARKLVFLRSGQLLLASDGTIQRLDSRTFSTRKLLRMRARHISVDSSESRLVASAWPNMKEILSRKKKALPLQLTQLPSLKVLRRFRFPDLEMTKSVISRDGRLIAFEAQKIGRFIRRIVVIDRETGHEVARRRLDLAHEMAFLPDNRTLAIGVSESTAGNPIKFWRLPVAPKTAGARSQN